MTLEELNEIQSEAKSKNDKARRLRDKAKRLGERRRFLAGELEQKNIKNVDDAIRLLTRYSSDDREIIEKEILDHLVDICRICEMRLEGQARGTLQVAREKQKQVDDFFQGEENA